MCLWTIWEELNKLMWNGGMFDPIGALTWSMKLLQHYQVLHPKKEKQKHIGRVKQKWAAPPSERLKINCDGLFFRDKGEGGARVVVQNAGGNCVVVVSKFLPHLNPAFHCEVEACRIGLQPAVEQG